MSQRTRIGQSELEIAPLVLGANVFGWTSNRDDSFAVLDAFVAAGANAVDTADGYSHWVPGNTGGESETIIGEWLASRNSRDAVVIATKVSTHPNFRGLSPQNVRRAAEASLQRVGTDVIDLYYAHYDDAETELEQTVAAFSGLVDAGLIRAIGVSNYSADRLAQWLEIARAGGYHLPVALQPHYNLVERDYESNGLREGAAGSELAVFPYYSLASGFLAGKYRTATDAETPGASVRAGGAAKYLTPGGSAVLTALDAVAQQHRVEVATVSLAWLRQQPLVTAPIASARSVAQLPALLESIHLQLSEAELAYLGAAGQ